MKANFQKRQAALLREQTAIGMKMEAIEGNPDQRALTEVLDAEHSKITHELFDQQDRLRARPVRSRHGVLDNLRVIRDRAEIVLGPFDDDEPFNIIGEIDELIAKIERWRQDEPVIFGGVRGRVNA
jgi:hypothetical protein